MWLMCGLVSMTLDVEKGWNCDFAVAGEIEPTPAMIFTYFSHPR
jgi:hypothetical protein